MPKSKVRLHKETLAVHLSQGSDIGVKAWRIVGTPFAVMREVVSYGWKTLPLFPGHWIVLHVPTGVKVSEKTRPLVFLTRQAAVQFCSRLTHPDWSKAYKRIPKHLREEFLQARSRWTKTTRR